MKRNFLLSVILIFAFLSALGGSICNAAHAFVGGAYAVAADNQTIDNAEDISLEDVVPVDPFLGSISFSKPELVQLFVFENIKCGLFALIQDSNPASSLPNTFIQESSCAEKWLRKGLWLELSNLRL